MNERLGRNPFAKKSQSIQREQKTTEPCEVQSPTQQPLEGEIIELQDGSPSLIQMAPPVEVAVSILRSFFK